LAGPGHGDEAGLSLGSARNSDARGAGMNDNLVQTAGRTIEIVIIGTIHTPFLGLENMPIQPNGARDTVGEVIVDDCYVDGLRDLKGFSHIHLLYHFHKAFRTEMLTVPFLDTQKRGVFATRSPLRPAHIGMSIVELLQVTGNRLQVRGLDILDGTPLIDIKPYIPHFDCRSDATSGWMKASLAEIAQKRSDDRFAH
jgi:tRNA (adenine37-N6)-methyltransferase